MKNEAIKELLYKMADDQLVLGHRNSEWNGLGPILEEDIAFSSMAQDKIGQSLEFYSILNEMGEKDPDTIAFTRKADKFKCCQYVEHPIGEYDFSLVRHFFFDYADYHRFELLKNSKVERIAMAAKKFQSESKYHIMHANAWMKQLGNSDVSIERMQNCLNEGIALALGIFEPSPMENVLIEEGVFEGEKKLSERWLSSIQSILSKTELSMPDISTAPINGGRQGKHTPHLQPLLDEMSEVFSIDPEAEW